MGKSSEGPGEGSGEPRYAPTGPCPGPGHVLVPLPRQDSAPAVVCTVAAAPTPRPSLAAPALGPRTAHSPAQSRGLK